MEFFLANWRELCLAVVTFGMAVTVVLLMLVLAYACYRMAKSIK